MDAATGERFKSDGEESSDLVSANDLVRFEKQVREADCKQTKRLVDDKVFELESRPVAQNTMNCLQLRKIEGGHHQRPPRPAGIP